MIAGHMIAGHMIAGHVLWQQDRQWYDIIIQLTTKYFNFSSLSWKPFPNTALWPSYLEPTGAAVVSLGHAPSSSGRHSSESK